MRLVFALVLAVSLAVVTASEPPHRPHAVPPSPPVPQATPVTPGPPTTVVVVAHQDDDLLFINPDVSADIAAGRKVVTVFMTAGDAGKGPAYWQGREAGARAAYAQMARTGNRWLVGRTRIGGQPVVRAQLAGKPITLLFLRLPDGRGYARHGFATMRRLWSSRIPRIRSVDGVSAWTKASLTGALTRVYTAHRPDVIRMLDFVGIHGDEDHSDHYTSADFAWAAHEAYPRRHRVAGYLGYPAEHRAANLSVAERTAKMRTFLAYARHDSHVCANRAACLSNTYGVRMARRWMVSEVRTSAPWPPSGTRGGPPA